MENKSFGDKMCQIADQVNIRKIESIVTQMVSQIMESIEKAASNGEYSIKLYEKNYPMLYNCADYNCDKYTFLHSELVNKLSAELKLIGLTLVKVSQKGDNTETYKVYTKTEEE